MGFFVETMLQSASRARRFRFDAQRGMLFEDTSIPETPEEVVSEADSNALLRSFADEASAGQNRRRCFAELLPRRPSQRLA